jgi:hypothetical protein
MGVRFRQHAKQRLNVHAKLKCSRDTGPANRCAAIRSRGRARNRDAQGKNRAIQRIATASKAPRTPKKGRHRTFLPLRTILQILNLVENIWNWPAERPEDNALDPLIHLQVGQTASHTSTVVAWHGDFTTPVSP